jgi:choline dehydrogenase-like flavoprotein
MVVNLVFYPSNIQPPASLKLRKDFSLDISGTKNLVPLESIQKIVRHLRSLGALAHSKLVVKVPHGGGIHYAGTLPMKLNSDRPYTCSPTGLLWGTSNVYVADGAGFPRLPAKNHSFTLMANAMRIAKAVRLELTPYNVQGEAEA